MLGGKLCVYVCVYRDVLGGGLGCVLYWMLSRGEGVLGGRCEGDTVLGGR